MTHKKNIMTLQAKPVVKNKFWIVEQEGKTIATIQAAPDGVVLVHGSAREKFANIKLLSARYNIKVGKSTKKPKPASNTHEIYDFPTSCKPHNEIYDVANRLPFFTKIAKSKSYYCAGYYAILINDEWNTQFCPKRITVKRYKYHGPYKSQAEATNKITQLSSIIR